MIHFFRNNTETVVKMILNQVVLIFFSFVLAMATSKHNAVFICVSIFCILFYLFLLYTMCWEIGAKDKLRIEGGRMDPAPWKCALLALIANAVNIVCALLALIGKLGLQFAEDLSLWARLTANPITAEQIATAAENDMVLVGELLAEASPAWAANLYSVSDTIVRALQMMYIGVVKSVAPHNPLIYFVTIATAIATCGVAYLLGTKNLRIFGGARQPHTN